MRLKKNIRHRGFLIERLVRELYCDVFGISDLNDKDKPLAMVEVGPKDGYHTLSPLYARIREYRIYSINERYSVDLIDFLNLPRHLTDQLIEDARIGLRNAEKIRNGVEDDARAQLKKEGFRTAHL